MRVFRDTINSFSFAHIVESSTMFVKHSLDVCVCVCVFKTLAFGWHFIIEIFVRGKKKPNSFHHPGKVKHIFAIKNIYSHFMSHTILGTHTTIYSDIIEWERRRRRTSCVQEHKLKWNTTNSALLRNRNIKSVFLPSSAPTTTGKWEWKSFFF